MSGCGCTGHYHNGGCADQNPVFWRDGPGPVNPTPEEVGAQRARNETAKKDSQKRLSAWLTDFMAGNVRMPK